MKEGYVEAASYEMVLKVYFLYQQVLLYPNYKQGEVNI